MNPNDPLLISSAAYSCSRTTISSPRTRPNMRFWKTLGILLTALGMQTAAWGGTMTLSNTAELEWGNMIDTTGDPVAATQGPTTLYPSEIAVSGVTSQTVTQVEVTLNDISHPFAGDLEVLLVGPQGQQTILMADTGGGGDLVDSDLTFSSTATQSLPFSAGSSDILASGTYLPTSQGSVAGFPAPAPQDSSSAPADLSIFDGTDPNGTWQLYVFDDAGGDTGSIAGWSLRLTIPDLLVTNTDDAGPGSLRDTILNAPDTTTICFSPDVFDSEDNKTITLSSVLSLGNKTLTIDASSVGGVTIDGGEFAFNLFANSSGGSLTLNSLNLTGATINAIYNENSTLTVNNCALYRNQGDGAIYNSTDGICTINNSTIAFNTGSFGVGFLSRGSSATLNHVTVANNIASGAGSAGIVHEAGTLTLDRCLLSNPDSTAPFGKDLGGAGGTVVATTPNFIRSIGGPNAYASSFPAGPVVGTDTDPIEPLLVGDSPSSSSIGDPLFNYGGPTLALMPQLGSPAINASGVATGVDQRGVAPVGARDLGAIETTWNDNTTSTPPSGFLADVTTPLTPISSYPTDLTYFSSSAPLSSLLDEQESTVLPNVTTNWAITLSPTGANFSLSGVSLTSRSTGGSTGLESSPNSFLLLGSNNLNSFHPLVSATLQPFSAFNETQTIFFTSPLPPFAHYRLILPDNFDFPDFLLTSLGEIELLGAPLPPWDELRITDSAFSSTSGSVSAVLTCDTIPGKTYAVFSASGNLNSFATNSGTQVPTSEFTANSWNSTTVSVGSNASSNFWRIQEILPLP